MTPLLQGGALRRSSPILRFSAFYFWLMSTTALATPYLALWLHGRGLSEEQIGTINAAPLIVVMLFNIFVGRAADLMFSWRTVLVAGAAMTTVTPLVLGLAQGFVWHLVGWVLVLAPLNLTIPVADAGSARSARAEGRDFASIRLWGTVGHMAVTAAAGLVVSVFGIGAFLPMLVFVSAMRLLTALRLPRMAQTAPRAAGGTAAASRGDLRRFRQPWFVLPLLAGALINASHAMQNVFGAIYWAESGLSPLQIAILWAVGTGSEILIMSRFGWIAARLSARGMLALAGGVAALRWCGLALEPGFWALLALQTLHMFTFGLSYLATVNFLVNWTDDSVGGRAQSLLSLMRQSTAAAAMIGFGFLAHQLGASAYGIAAGLGLLSATLALLSLWLMPSRRLEETR